MRATLGRDRDGRRAERAILGGRRRESGLALHPVGLLDHQKNNKSHDQKVDHVFRNSP